MAAATTTSQYIQDLSALMLRGEALCDNPRAGPVFWRSVQRERHFEREKKTFRRTTVLLNIYVKEFPGPNRIRYI